MFYLIHHVHAAAKYKYVKRGKKEYFFSAYIIQACFMTVTCFYGICYQYIYNILHMFTDFHLQILQFSRRIYFVQTKDNKT